jgi:hypothetical protein
VTSIDTAEHLIAIVMSADNRRHTVVKATERDVAAAGAFPRLVALVELLAEEARIRERDTLILIAAIARSHGGQIRIHPADLEEADPTIVVEQITELPSGHVVYRVARKRTH